MKKINTIAECFAEAIATWNPIYIAKAVWILFLQRRLVEAIYGAYCYIRFSPSTVNSQWNSLVSLEDNIKQSFLSMKDELLREEICHVFGHDYAVDYLPQDFSGARIEGIIFYKNLLVIGEYGRPGKRIAVVSHRACIINGYYEKKISVRHIHSICSISNTGSVIVATGDTAKHLDLWTLKDGTINFTKHLKTFFAGYTAMLRMGDEFFLGTDFPGRPNYLELLSKEKKIFFPEKAYSMFVLRLAPYKQQYLLCLSRESKCLGGRHALSVLDVKQEEFIFCDYVQYEEPETANNELHFRAIAFCSIPTSNFNVEF